MDDIQAQLERLLRRKIERIEAACADALPELQETGLGLIQDLWPSDEWASDVHPYATGASAGGWTAEVDDGGLTVTFRNHTTKRGREYSAYVNEGYTRHGGARSAASWFMRQQDEPYADTAIFQAVAEWLPILSTRISNALR